jgi:hypothetical protein
VNARLQRGIEKKMMIRMMMIHPASFLFILIHLLSRVAPFLTPPTPFPYQTSCPDQVSGALNE